MPQAAQDQEEDKTYHKRIDELIEDAEIEAEIDAEKKVRSKNARLLSISLVGIALIAFIYFQVRTGSQTTPATENETGPLPELAQAPAVEPTLLPEAPVQNADEVPEPAEELQAAVPGEEISETAHGAAVNATESSAPAAAVIVEPPASISPAAPVEKTIAPVVAQAPVAPPVEKIKTAEIAAPPAPPAPAKKTSTRQYHVQLGVFSMEDNAKRFLKTIREKNFKPEIQTKSIEASRYVVFVGGFSSKEGGNQAISDLKAKGFNPVMENFEDNSHTLVLGKFKTLSSAENLRDQLSVHGFLSSARKSQVKTHIHVVQLGPFASLPQAKKSQRNIERAGFSSSFIR
ncbi:MAG: hypothetical protein NPINA01_14330 [Nitrospinaceae bacterium]|nr:MAG: hypothetical protein NPINA01_14330 [Nitrospinaceae bacterium]